MKNRFSYIVIFAVLLISSCTKWLDVKPKIEVETQKMFSSETGFKDALTGCYISLTNRSLYGEALTVSTIEYLAIHWTTQAKTVSEAIQKHDYTNVDVIAKMDDIYARLYKTIAYTNELLAYIDTNKSSFKNEKLRLMIKGEALAIRAFCHFDILRLFGPIPRKLDVKTTNKLLYMKNVTIETIQERHTYDQYKTFIDEDLRLASDLLKVSDPIHVLELASIGEKEPFMANRTFRFNYYAVEGIRARFYLYTQQPEKAYKCANEIIVSEKFTLAGKSDYDRECYSLASEHLLSLSVFNIDDYLIPQFENPSSSLNVFQSTKLKITKDVFDNVTTDYRFDKIWYDLTVGSSTVYFTMRKYFQSEEGDFKTNQLIPLLRLSEIYLIAMEAGTLAQCNELAKVYYPVHFVNTKEFEDDNARNREILKEYRRNFYGEGQMFYTYKRLATPKMLWSIKDTAPEEYIIPMPITDIFHDI